MDTTNLWGRDSHNNCLTPEVHDDDDGDDGGGGSFYLTDNI